MSQQVFLAYSSADSEAVQLGLTQRLSTLELDGAIELFVDKKLDTGIEWERTLRRKLEETDIFLILASVELLQPDSYFRTREWPTVRRLHSNRQAQILWCPINLSVEEVEKQLPALAEILAINTSPLWDWKSHPEVGEEDFYHKVATAVRIASKNEEQKTEMESGIGSEPTKLDPRGRTEIAQAYSNDLRSSLNYEKPAQIGEGGVRSLPLRKLYVSLVADPTSLDERNKAKQLSQEFSGPEQDGKLEGLQKPADSIEVQRLRTVREPALPPSRAADSKESNRPVDRDREGESLHSIVRRDRCCVILGDPGSGKSVLCKWLASELFRCRSEAKPSEELGPARQPFLVILRDFGEKLVQREVTSLLDYLHKIACPSSASRENWRLFVDDVIDSGQAFLILDGLDEVPREMKLEVRRFVEDFSQEFVESRPDATSRPDLGLGNQILLTSRITGYYQTALQTDRFAHYIIRPMSKVQIKEYCEHWCDAMTRSDRLPLLLEQVFDIKRPGVLSMARNPLLLSVLCQLVTGSAERRDAHEGQHQLDAPGVGLPEIRAALYERVIYQTAKKWRERAIEGDEKVRPVLDLIFGSVETVLSLYAPLAAHMHRNTVNNEIRYEVLREQLLASLTRLEGKRPYQVDPDDLTLREETLAQAMEREVGVLSERSKGQFTFLHLTFQEYLAGFSLLLPESPQATPQFRDAEELCSLLLAEGYMTDPRWRQPVLLMFGQLAWIEDQKPDGVASAFPRLAEVVQLLEEKRSLKPELLLTEQWAIFLADVLFEVPDRMLLDENCLLDLLQQAIQQLLASYGRLGPDESRLRVRRVFAERLAAIRRRIGREEFENCIIEACRSNAGEIAATAAHLFTERCWITKTLVEFFAQQRKYDSPQWNWAIHRLLRQTITLEPFLKVHTPTKKFDLPPPEAVNETRLYHLALSEWERLQVEFSERSDETTLREASAALSNKRDLPLSPAVVNHLGDDMDRFLSVVASLGSLGDHDAGRRASKYREYAHWLQRADADRQNSLTTEPWRYPSWFGCEDTVYNMAVVLDTMGKSVFRPDLPPKFDLSKAIYHDGLSDDVSQALQAGTSIATALEARYRTAADEHSQAEVVAVGKVCGCSAVASRKADPGLLLWHLQRLENEMADACFRGQEMVNEWLHDLKSQTALEEWSRAAFYLAHAQRRSGVLEIKIKKKKTQRAGKPKIPQSPSLDDLRDFPDLPPINPDGSESPSSETQPDSKLAPSPDDDETQIATSDTSSSMPADRPDIQDPANGVPIVEVDENPSTNTDVVPPNPSEICSHQFSDQAEKWGETFVGTDDDPVYFFAVFLDTLPKPSDSSSKYRLEMLRALARSSSIATLNVGLPDLIELGGGSLPLPSSAFYDAVFELADIAAIRIRPDLAEGWITEMLKPLFARDPIAKACVWFHAPNTAEDVLEKAPTLVKGPLQSWRAATIWAYVPSEDEKIGRFSEGNFLKDKWLLAWDQVGSVADRLTLARDAVSLHLIDDDQLAERILQEVSSADPVWALEACLVASYVARTLGDQRSEPWIGVVLDLLERVEEIDWCVEVLVAIRTLVETLGSEQAKNRLIAFPKELPECYRLLADGKHASWLRQWVRKFWPADESTRTALAATLLVASAVEEQSALRPGGAGAIASEQVWKKLAAAIRRKEAGEARILVDRLLEFADSRSLALSEAAATALEEARRDSDFAESSGIQRLLPALNRPTAQSLRIIREWKAMPPGSPGKQRLSFSDSLACHAALWLVEVEKRYNAEDVSILKRLISEGDDGSAGRARLALCGPLWNLDGKRPALFELSKQLAHGGPETMERLGVYAHEETFLERHVLLGERALREWRMDDPDTLAGWFKRTQTEPEKDPILETIFGPWRWSKECLLLLDDWLKETQDAKCKYAFAEWLGILWLLGTSKEEWRYDLSFVPSVPSWDPQDTPAISWLGKSYCDWVVVDCLKSACKPGVPLEKIVTELERVLRAEVTNLREVYENPDETRENAFASLGDAVTQWVGDSPENPGDNSAVETLPPHLIPPLVMWTLHSLSDWSRLRSGRSTTGSLGDSRWVNHQLCISQISILACVCIHAPNAVRHAALHLGGEGEENLSELLCEVIRYFRNDRIVQAAWTVLARCASPKIPVRRLWQALRCSMQDRPIIRDRALSVLGSSDGLMLVDAVASSETELKESLTQWKTEPSGQTVLAFARFFALLAQSPSVSPELRQRIQTDLRSLSHDPDAHRPISRLTGTGGEDSPFAVTTSGWLDLELRALDADLLAQMPSTLY
ncbi:MAG: hypothetical protein CMO55_10125 [Verrucomicrobiales bacterium]|nr:hypothetical protein [Verrucomicrobiales bacterium]